MSECLLRFLRMMLPFCMLTSSCGCRQRYLLRRSAREKSSISFDQVAALRRQRSRSTEMDANQWCERLYSNYSQPCLSHPRVHEKPVLRPPAEDIERWSSSVSSIKRDVKKNVSYREGEETTLQCVDRFDKQMTNKLDRGYGDSALIR
jgi:hypothetical protein